MLEAFAREGRLSLGQMSVAVTMEKFFWSEAEKGLSPAMGRAALYGWLHLRCATPTVEANNLEGPRKALKGWANLVSDRPRDPLPEEAVLQLALRLARRKQLLSAAAVII